MKQRSAHRATIVSFAFALIMAVSGCGVAPSTPAVSTTTPTAAAPHSDAGWAGAETPVTGGSGARPEHIYRVKNRSELVRALSADGSKKATDTPKIVYVEGVIDLNVDEQNRPLAEENYRDAAFSWDEYTKAYAPEVWGKKPLTGPLEEARKRSSERQAAVVVIHVGSNTSLIGVGNSAKIKNGNIMVRDAHNVILQNITFEDAYDFFPAWDPKDNANGEWNSEYDTVTIYNSRRVWVDHCAFSDGVRPDKINRELFGRPMQFHDGLLDVVRGSDLVTISYSHFKDHDKGMLIGNSDSRTDDDGKLRVTLHHNWFENVTERSPRVRYGRVHAYNNLYTASSNADYPYVYSIGVGFKSRLIVENNVFDIPQSIRKSPFKLWRGDRITARGNRWSHELSGDDVDALGSLRKQAGAAVISDTSDWSPPYTYKLDAATHLVEFLRTKTGVKQ